MSDPLSPADPQPPVSTGTPGHTAFIGESTLDPFAFLPNAHVPATNVSLPPSGPQPSVAQPSLALDGGGEDTGTQLSSAPLTGDHEVAREVSQAESDGGRSPGLLPSPTSAFSPYHVDDHRALPSLLEDPPGIIFSNVTILTPSPVPPSPDKKDGPPKPVAPEQSPPSNVGNMSTTPLVSHPGSDPLQQLPPLSVVPPGMALGEVPHPQHKVELTYAQHQPERTKQQVEVPFPQHQVEVPHPQHQVEVSHPQHPVEAPHSQHQVEVPHPQHQVEVPHPQHRVEAPRAQHQVEVSHPQHQVEVPHPQHRVEVPHPQHQVEVPHPQHRVEAPHAQHQVEVSHPQHQVEVPHPQHRVEVPHPQHRMEAPRAQHQVEVSHPQHQVEVPHPQHRAEVPHPQHRVEAPHAQHQVEVTHPQHQIEAPHPRHPVETRHPQHPVETPHPQHPVETPHPQHPVETPHPQHPVETPHPQHQVEVSHPQHPVETPHPQHSVEAPHPQHQVEVSPPQHPVETPHPQRQGTLPSALHQEDSSNHALHSHRTLAPTVGQDATLSPIPPTGHHSTVAVQSKPPITRHAGPGGPAPFSDHLSDQRLTTSLPPEGLQTSGRAHPSAAYEKEISRQTSEGFSLEPPALPSQAPSSGPPSRHSPSGHRAPAERSNVGQKESHALERFTEPTLPPDVRPVRNTAYRDVQPVQYDDQSDRHSYYEGERSHPSYYDQWTRYERPPYSSHHYGERDRRQYYGNHGYQQDHRGNQRYRHYSQHHYDYDPYHHHRYYDDWGYAWQQQQDRDQQYDRRYTDPRQRGYPSDYWMGGDRRQDSQYSVHDDSSVYNASQSWVDPTSASHISGYGHYDSLSYTDEHTREDYSMYGSQYERWDGETPGDYPMEQWIQSTAGYPASEPVRDTPPLFTRPHAPARFGVGGVLLVVTPTAPSQYSAATVELHSLQELVPEYRQFAASVESNPGPLIPGETPKSAVVSFVSEEAARSRETAEKSEDSESQEGWKERALLWEYLLLLCRQNGVVVPSDLCELLTRDAGMNATSFELAIPANDTPSSEKLHQFRLLILSGRKKDALDHACRQGLWGHALMVATTMEEQSRHYVVNRFTASLLSSDPLNTFYTLMLGRMPIVSKPDGLTRGGDWRPHLSVMLSNKNASDGMAAIVSLGDSLLSRGRLFAAHFCYKVAEVEFGGYSEKACRYSLLGVDPRTLEVGQYPSLNQLAMTEVYEYAMTLGQTKFSLPKFQVFKLLHIWKLVEAGLPVKALGYCEVTAVNCLKCPELVNPSALYQLAELSVRLHFCVHGGGVVHSELPQWIIELCKVITIPESTQEQGSNSLPKASPATSQEVSARSSPVASGHFGDSTGQAAVPQQVDVVDGAESTSADPVLLGSSSQVSVHSSVSQQQPQQEDHAHSGWDHQEDPKNAATQPLLQDPAPLDQPPVPENSGYGQVPGGYGVQQSQEQMSSQPSSSGGLYQEHYGYGQQVGAQQGFGAPPSQGHMTGASLSQSHMTGAPPSSGYMAVAPPSQGHMTGAPPSSGYMAVAPPSQGHMTGASLSQSHMTGAPPSSGQAYAQPVPNATTGYATMTPMVPQEYSNPPLPPSNQDIQRTDPDQEQNKDEDPGKDKDSSKPASGGVMHFFRNLFPKKSGAHLPDDRPEDKKIVWDPEKKKWINKDAGDEDTDAPPPPPTDMELQSMMQQRPTSVPAGGTSGPGALTQAAPGSTAPHGVYGQKGRRARSRYVDVFGGSKSTSSQLAPPPTVMQLGGGQTFTGNFFVPTAAGSTAGPGESMSYFSGAEQPFPAETSTTTAQPS